MKNSMVKLFILNRVIILTLLLITANLAFANVNNYNAIEYNLSFIDTKKPILTIEAIIKGKFSHQIIINLPHSWGGVDYTGQIKNVKVLNKHCKLIKTNNHQATITLPFVAESLKISYDIHHKPCNLSNIHEAIIISDLIHAPGYGLFALPADLDETSKIAVKINWRKIKPSWHIISSYGINKSMTLNITGNELLHAIYGAGKIKLHQINDKYNTQPIFLSFYGNFDTQEKNIISDLKAIMLQQRKFFNDSDFPYYAISLIASHDPHYTSGTRLYNSFTASLSSSFVNNESRIQRYILFAHENLHNWINGKLSNNQDEELNYWWSEGFTEYYARVIALRTGDIKLDHFIKEVNELLRNYYLSPVIREPNSRIKKDFWHNTDVEKLPYYRGFTFAIYLNNIIKNHNPSSSLDDIMHALFKNYQGKRFSIEMFKDIAQQSVGNSFSKEIEDFIIQGNVISLENISLPVVKILSVQNKIEVYQIKDELSATEKEQVIKFFE